MEMTPAGTTAWPFASGVYSQYAATPPSASRTKIVANITAWKGPSACAVRG